MKAVVWTDTLQAVIMFAGIAAVFAVGATKLGGLGEVLRIAGDGGRLDLFNFSFDPRPRHTFWAIVFGGTVLWMTVFAVNQAQIQRALACPSLRLAQAAYWINVPFTQFSSLVGLGLSLTLYAYYSTCDPIRSIPLESPDQLLPLFVMETVGHLSGLPGLFVAAIFSAALSTLSSGFNSLAAATLKDVVQVYIKKDMSESQSTLAAKLLALGYGVVCLALSFAASELGTVLQITYSFMGTIGGPILGIFTLGMFFPWANYKGAYAGLLFSTFISFWIVIGAYVYKPYISANVNPIKALSVEGCASTLVNTSLPTTVMSLSSTEATAAAAMERPPLIDFYSVSYMYYSGISVAVCVLVGLAVSFITGPTKPRELNPKLISPVVHTLCCCLPLTVRTKLSCGIDFESTSDSEDKDDSDLDEVKEKYRRTSSDVTGF